MNAPSVPEATRLEDSVVQPLGAPLAIRCRDIPNDGVEAIFSGSTCPWIVRRGPEEQLSLEAMTLAPASSWAGAPPQGCVGHRCVLHGVESSVGPLVIVARVSPRSEMPSGGWLGSIDGDALVFEDLWEGAGSSVVDGGIELGPAYGLAPYDCGGTLALFAVARVAQGNLREPEPQLQAREGLRGAPGLGGAAEREACQRIEVALP